MADKQVVHIKSTSITEHKSHYNPKVISVFA